MGAKQYKGIGLSYEQGISFCRMLWFVKQTSTNTTKSFMSKKIILLMKFEFGDDWPNLVTCYRYHCCYMVK